MPRIVIDVPFPVSVNRIWRSGNKRVYRSPLYLKWIKDAGVQWIIQRPRLAVRSIKGEYKLMITVNPPDSRLRDIGNLEKVCSDFLQSMDIIENDHLCRLLIVRYGTIEQAPLGARLLVSSL